MALKIDFNNPQILAGHLEQALPQYGLQEVKGILIGKEGGLAYSLFKDSYNSYNIVREFGATSLNEMSVVRAYFDAVQRYVQQGSEHAKKFGFDLVEADTSKTTVTNGLDLGSYIYYAGIGSATIENVERFKRFLEMVKEGHPEIERQYAKVRDASKVLRVN